MLTLKIVLVSIFTLFRVVSAKTSMQASYCTTIVVDIRGNGNFTSIQDAILSIPTNNRQWVTINIKPGTYKEKVLIPREKPFIILRGSGMEVTQIVWNDHTNILQAPTFESSADNLVAHDISFVNSYNYPLNGQTIRPAVAALISGDKSAFYNCRFAGYQDTLWDNQGRHLFSGCIIEGAVDFIFGAAQSIYQSCNIKILGNGYITAQARENQNDASGFVFTNCRVEGSGVTFLGRPWRRYARVVFYKSYLSSVVNVKGWDIWDSSTKVNEPTFAEMENTGPGADTTNRVKWEKEFPIQYLSSLFVNYGGWLPQPNCGS